MSELVAVVSSGKGTWVHVSQMIEKGDWGKVLLITNKFGAEKFAKPENAECIVINPEQSLSEITKQLRAAFKEKLNGMEVALNIISGNGKEHTAVLSALMSVGVGFRLFALTKDGIQEF